MSAEKLSRTYKFATGGGYDASDMWYEEWEETFYEGDTCPQCKEGKLKVSRNNKLYCSAICWIDEEDEDIDQIEDGQP